MANNYVSHKANSNIKTFMYGANYSTVRKSLAVSLIKRTYKFDRIGLIGNKKTEEFIERIGIEKAIEIVDGIAKLLYKSEIIMKPKYARNAFEVDALEIKTKYFSENNYYFKASVLINNKSNKPCWYVVLHD